MPDGELRRPPQLWEQRLARTTSILGVGISSSGDATSIVTPTPPPGAGGGTEPAPVLPPPGDFIKPSTPQLIGAVQGINVLWDGLNSVGDLWPYDTAWVDVHVSTAGTGFTVGTATLQGRLARPGGLYVGGLAAGTTYYFRLQGVDPAGNVTDPSDAASGLTGLTTASDYGTATIGSGAVSFDARAIGGITTTVGTSQPSSPNIGDIWLDTTGGTTTHKRWDGSSWVTQAWSSSSIGANVITATQIAAGAVTAGAIAAGAITAEKIQAGAVTTDKLTAGTITGFYISGGTINGGLITGGTVTGSLVQSSSGSARIVLNTGDTLDFYSSNVKRGDLFGVTVDGNNGIGVTGALDVSSNVYANGLDIVSSVVDMPGVYSNSTTGLDEVGITTDGRLRRLASTQDIKYDMAALSGTLDQSVNADRQLGVPTVTPADILDLAVVEFSVIDEDEPTDRRVLGFVAEDVAAKFPIAASRKADGSPAGVLDGAVLAALLAVVQEQAQQIEDLRSRIEALEA